MSRAAIPTMLRCLKGTAGHVCVRRDWANFAGQGIVGTKREPQPTTYEGKAPGS